MSGLLLDAQCDRCGYSERNLALGANADFLLERPDGWLSVVTACPACRRLVDATVSRKEAAAAEGAPDLVCPECGQSVPQPNDVYPELTLTGVAESETTVIEEQPCPRCGERTLTVYVVGTFE